MVGFSGWETGWLYQEDNLFGQCLGGFLFGLVALSSGEGTHLEVGHLGYK